MTVLNSDRQPRFYADDELLPGAVAARAVGQTRQLLRRWVELGYLKPTAAAVDGRPLFRMKDVRIAERTTRHSRRSRRGSVKQAVSTPPDPRGGEPW